MTGAAMASLDRLADRFFAAIAAGDVEAVLACYAADAQIWHNTSDVIQSPAANGASLRRFFAHLRQRSYVDIRRIVHPGGFVQQHVLTGVLQDGSRFAWPACLIVAVEGGLIIRVDEYLDSAPAATLFASYRTSHG